MFKLICNMHSYEHQDWKPVVIRSTQKAKNEKKVVPNLQNAPGTREFKKLNEDDIPILNKMTNDKAKDMIQARNAQKMSQQDLAKKLNMPLSIIKEYENATVKNFNKGIYKKIMTSLGTKPS